MRGGTRERGKLWKKPKQHFTAREGEFVVYCREVSQTPLLTREQEIRCGHALNSIWPRQRVKARELLVRANLRFAFKLAKRFTGRGLDLADLIQEAAFGLLRAAQDYDPSRARFCTHAGHWIKQCLVNACADRGRLVRVPRYQRRLVHLHEQTVSEFAAVNGSLTSQDVLQRTCLLAQAKSIGISNPAVLSNGLIALRAGFVPLHCLDDEGDDVAANEPESREPSPVAVAEQNEINLLVVQAMDTLPPRQREVLRMRCGFADGKPMILNDIASLWGISRERVRQLERQALTTLREILGESPSCLSVGNVRQSSAV